MMGAQEFELDDLSGGEDEEEERRALNGRR
jgi:hypothetical protein